MLDADDDAFLLEWRRDGTNAAAVGLNAEAAVPSTGGVVFVLLLVLVAGGLLPLVDGRNFANQLLRRAISKVGEEGALVDAVVGGSGSGVKLLLSLDSLGTEVTRPAFAIVNVCLRPGPGLHSSIRWNSQASEWCHMRARFQVGLTAFCNIH